MSLKLLSAANHTKLFCLQHGFPALVFAIIMVFIYPQTNWDIRLSDLFYDKQLQVFPLTGYELLSLWMHERLKWVMVVIALTCLGLSIVGAYFSPLKRHRKSLLWVFVGMVISTSAVAILKHYNQHACPWDLTLYGGHLPLLALFESLPAGVEAGQCFPAGHPSGGFALMAFYFAFMVTKPRFAQAMLAVGLMMGLIMGGVQIIRGAHFLSHVLWSGWVVWMTLMIMRCLWSANQHQSD